MSNIERNKMIMWRMIDEIWNNGKYEVAEELFHPEHMSPSPPELPPGADGVKMLAKMFREGMRLRDISEVTRAGPMATFDAIEEARRQGRAARAQKPGDG